MLSINYTDEQGTQHPQSVWAIRILNFSLESPTQGIATVTLLGWRDLSEMDQALPPVGIHSFNLEGSLFQNHVLVPLAAGASLFDSLYSAARNQMFTLASGDVIQLFQNAQTV